MSNSDGAKQQPIEIKIEVVGSSSESLNKEDELEQKNSKSEISSDEDNSNTENKLDNIEAEEKGLLSENHGMKLLENSEMEGQVENDLSRKHAPQLYPTLDTEDDCNQNLLPPTVTNTFTKNLDAPKLSLPNSYNGKMLGPPADAPSNNNLLVPPHEDYYHGPDKPLKLSITIGGSDTKLDQIEKEVVVLPPDGGWGWVVVAASFMCNLLVDGIIFTSGMLFGPIMEEFGVSYSQVSWVSSLIGGFYLLAGPFVSSLANAYGFRVVCIIGAIISAAACGISYFATGIYYLYFFYGILAGIGFGFIYVPAVIATGFYFEKRRALATGLAVCGSGIGTFTLSPLTLLINEHYGWRIVLLAYGGLILTCIIYGMAFRPLSPSTGRVIDKTCPTSEPEPLLMRIKRLRDEELKNCKSTSSMEMKPANNHLEPLKPRRVRVLSENFLTIPGGESFSRKGSTVSIRHESLKPLYRSDAFFTGSMQRIPEYKRSNTTEHYLASITHIPESMMGEEGVDDLSDKRCCGPDTINVLTKMFDFSLFRSPTFLVLSFSGFLTLMSLFVPFIFLPSFIEATSADLGLGPDEAGQTKAFLMSLIGICNTFGRVIAGWISDRPNVDAILVNNIALICGGVATVFLPFITNVSVLYGYGIVFGLSVAFFASLRSILLVELVGLEKLTNAFGLLLLIQGIAALFGSPIAGGFADLTGDFSMSFYVFGTLFGLSGVICIPLRKIKEWETKREERRQNNSP